MNEDWSPLVTGQDGTLHWRVGMAGHGQEQTACGEQVQPTDIVTHYSQTCEDCGSISKVAAAALSQNAVEL